MPIKFEVAGIPVPQGSVQARTDGAGHAFVVRANRSNLVAWRHSVDDEARRAMALRPAITGPVKVALEFRLPKPKSRPKKDRWPDRKPDLDKLIRAVLDGLTGVAFVDDAQVVILEARKSFFDPATDLSPGLSVSLWSTSDPIASPEQR